MARNSRKPARSGGLMLGLMLGVILGLSAAVAVAFFVTNAPVPFLDKTSRAPDQPPLTNVREAPDPNRGLAGTTGARDAQSSQSAQATSPNDAARATMTQDIDQLIASLSQGQPLQGQGPQAGRQQAPRAGASSTSSSSATPATGGPTLYHLQAGAFLSESEAEALKARILMLGLNGFVQAVQVDGTTLHRVRVGPFRGIDEMNRSRITLGKGGIPSAVVRP